MGVVQEDAAPGVLAHRGDNSRGITAGGISDRSAGSRRSIPRDGQTTERTGVVQENAIGRAVGRNTPKSEAVRADGGIHHRQRRASGGGQGIDHRSIVLLHTQVAAAGRGESGVCGGRERQPASKVDRGAGIVRQGNAGTAAVADRAAQADRPTRAIAQRNCAPGGIGDPRAKADSTVPAVQIQIGARDAGNGHIRTDRQRILVDPLNPCAAGARNGQTAKQIAFAEGNGIAASILNNRGRGADIHRRKKSTAAGRRQASEACERDDCILPNQFLTR